MTLRSIKEIRAGLERGQFHQELSRIYGDQAPRAAGRFLALLDGFCAFYGASEDREVCLLSTPGQIGRASCRERVYPLV